MWPWEVRLTPSPIGKVLSTLGKDRVKGLQMGGQACVLYGAAEFSRDVDVAVLAANADEAVHASNSRRTSPSPAMGTGRPC